jgi:hypothetical protein
MTTALQLMQEIDKLRDEILQQIMRDRIIEVCALACDAEAERLGGMGMHTAIAQAACWTCAENIRKMITPKPKCNTCIKCPSDINKFCGYCGLRQSDGRDIFDGAF